MKISLDLQHIAFSACFSVLILHDKFHLVRVLGGGRVRLGLLSENEGEHDTEMAPAEKQGSRANHNVSMGQKLTTGVYVRRFLISLTLSYGTCR